MLTAGNSSQERNFGKHGNAPVKICAEHAGLSGVPVFVNSTRPTCNITHDCTCNISRSTFRNNQGSPRSGAVAVTADSLTVNVNDSNFTGNAAAERYGGALDLTWATSADSAQHLSLQVGSFWL